MQKIEEKPLVSVIVLTYRNQDRLFQTLSTILEQDYPNIELLISDDASGIQNSKAISDWLEQNTAKHFTRIIIRCNAHNLGTVAHANLVAGLCEGTYLHFLPCGDGFCRPDALSCHIRFAEQMGSMVTTSQAFVSDEAFKKIYYLFPSDRRANLLSRKSPKQLYQVLCKKNIICAVATMFRKDFFLRGGFDPAYRYLEDWPAWLHLTREGFAIPCLHETTVYYVLSGISSENGNAYTSPRLLADMRLCHEKEIFPFLPRIPWNERLCLRYRYAGLQTGSRHLFALWQKVKSMLKRQILHR